MGDTKTPNPESVSEHQWVIPYPAIEHHGLISDRRTGALVAADGTLDWLCLPDADGDIVLGALLDVEKGGYWRLGPSRKIQGEQSYGPDSMLLQTRWNLETGTLELSDTMLWPDSERPPEQQASRVVLRRLRCTQGKVRCQFDLQTAINCESAAAEFVAYPSGFSMTLAELSLRVWSNYPLQAKGPRLTGDADLTAGEEIWGVFELGAAGHGWNCDAARAALDQNDRYWHDWLAQFGRTAPDQQDIRRTAMTVHALTYAPEGSVLAALTTSLPERIGGSWNADYRLCWVRDASLAVGILSRLGSQQTTEKYLHWLSRRRSRLGRPLQVLYGLRGEKHPRQRQLSAASGYRGSQPVRIGNHAYKQHQLGSLAFLADCAWTYVEHGGEWRPEYWDLIRRSANYVAGHWHEPENGIWELATARHYVHSKVLDWVTLERATRIARKTAPGFNTSDWETESAKIHQEVMEKGWSDRLGAFRQHYDGENLDASALLISVLGFLPGDHPRVLATIERISERLTLNGWVFRFDPLQTLEGSNPPLGAYEGAFLPCTLWLATAYAKAGLREKATVLLEKVEKAAGPLGLFAEAIDPRTGGSLGNSPLLFSHVEYVRAKLELNNAPQGAAR